MLSAIDNAIQAVLSGKPSYCKFLTANDSGENGSHQIGYYIAKDAWHMLFKPSHASVKGRNIDRYATIRWQDEHEDFERDVRFIYYGAAKDELRMTNLGRNFPFRKAEYTGALFVLIQQEWEYFDAYVFNREEDIDTFLDTLGISAAQTNRMIDLRGIAAETDSRVLEFLDRTNGEFPPSDEMSAAARTIADRGKIRFAKEDPDERLLVWTDMEFRLFHGIEERKYAEYLTGGFDSLESMIEASKSILNRRKSRAGKSLEHHLAAIFDANGLVYDAQAVTEGNKKPDFIFPSITAYHDSSFPSEEIVTLAAKTTCKDRWRQILNEADRLKDGNKYLCTLQQGITIPQMNEMKEEHVILVVPRKYHKAYAEHAERHASGQLMTIMEFVEFIQRLEEPHPEGRITNPGI